MEQNEQISAAADVFEVESIEGRIEFSIYTWIGGHCGNNANDGDVCSW